ncbi:autotransporter-associated beta strand protein [Chthoniobacter flavus]|uniref:autotransporter-associated beta strand repeat-containing protein n=1 Tax=Chthoniobacter flavus TaxID=191863 RepID=UPI00104EF66C|nr:autotransporter-associated beta strand repeat-containing protein [Chthoniobacter flavus]TCO92740.1 autotransporter-associated beta strand protein [Chthoniobacter flavus]
MKKSTPVRAIGALCLRKGFWWFALTFVLLAGVAISANVLFWDPDTNATGNNSATQANLGGAGTWDTTTNNWWDGVATDTTWSNDNFDSAVFGGTSGGSVTLGAPIVVGRITFNTGGYTVKPSGTNTLTLQTADGDPAPVIVANANATIGVSGGAGLVGNQGMVKAGGGTLTVFGNNSGFVGTTTLKSGTLTLSGDVDVTPNGTTSLGTAQPITLQSGTLRFLNNSGVAQYNSDILLQGNATINVDHATTGSSGVIELGALTLGSNTLTTTNGNGYGLRFMGTTTLNSAISTINATFNPSAGIFDAAGATTLGGMVTGPGALNKIGSGTLFVYNALGGPDNDYAGGTNVLQGTLALGDTSSQLGSGRVIVSPGAVLRIEDNLNFFSIETSGAGLFLQSSSTAFGVLGLDGDFTPGTDALQNMKISPYGAAVQINTPTTTFLGDFNFANFGTGAAGTGKVFLGAIVNTTLNGFEGQLTPGPDNEYRLGANASSGVTLTLSIPNILNAGDNASLVVGTPIQNIVSITNGTGTVLISDSQNYGGLTTVNSGSTLTASVAASPDALPLGTGATKPVIDVYGTLNLTGGDFAQLAQTTLNVSQARGANGALNLNVTSNEFAGIGTVNERLKDTVVLNFNGGTFSFAGYNSGNVTGAPLISSQTIGEFNFSATNAVNVTSAATATTDQDAILTLTNVNRVNNGSITFAHTGATQPVLGKPSAGTSSDIRIFITNLNGAAPVVTNGMLAPYLLDVSNVPLAGGATTANSTTVTVTSTVGLAPGMIVTGANIPTGASIVSIIDGTSFQISRPATTNATGQSFTANGQQFVTYGPDGVAPAAFDVQATTAATLQAATASQIVTVDAGFNTTANASVYALRIGDNTLGGTNTITIGSGASAEDGAGLILNLATARTDTPNFTFGTGGNREAMIYVTGGQTATLSGLISATGLTKTGPNTLVLTGNNVNLNGTLTVDQGTLQGTVGAFNYRPIVLNAGTLNYDNGGSVRYLNDLIVNGDSTVTAGDVEMPMVGDVTINPRAGGNLDPIVFNIAQGLSVSGDLVLNGDVNWNQTRADRNNDVRARVLVSGKVTGVGAFNKWSGSTSQTGVTAFLNGANDYQGGTTVNGGTLESLTALGTPFSTGAITVNPGSILRIASPDNIHGNVLTLNSDLAGLAVLSLAYSGNVGVNGGLTGTMNFNSGNLGGPFSAVFAIDAMGYSGDIDLSTLGGGTAFLGTAIGGNFSGNLTPAAVNSLIPSLDGNAPEQFAGGVYRLGGGGSGFLNFTGAANQLTGNNAVQIGAISNVTQGASFVLQNGGQNNNASNGQGAVQIVNVNDYTGPTILNSGAITGSLASPGDLSVGNNNALGTSKIIFNGGALQAPTNTGLPFLTPVITLSNDVGFTGDATFDGSTNLVLTGTFPLADNQVGVTRTFTVNNTTGMTIIGGDIIDGAGTASLNGITKTGSGPIEFRGHNTYSGFTNVNGGTIVVESDSDISVNSQITFNGGALGVWNQSMSTDRDYILVGNGTFDVGDARTLTQVGPNGSDLGSIISGPGMFIKNGFGTLILNGTNANSGGNAVQINNGILQISANVNLGDPAVNGQIVAGGGTLRVDGTFTSARNILPNTNITTSLGLNITDENTFTSTGLLNNNGTGIFTILKTGAGTFINNSNNSLKRLVVTNGVFQSSSNTPVAAAASEIDLSGGTLRLQNLTANQAVVTPLTNFLGGGHIELQSADGFSSQFAPTSLDRIATGTLVISAGTSTLGGAGNTNAVRILPDNMNFAADRTAVTTTSNIVTVSNTADLEVGMTVTGQGIPANATITAINSPTSITISANATAANTYLTFGGAAPRANAVNNGIFPASVVTADAAGLASFTTNDPTNGIVAFTGYTAIGATPATFNTPTVVGDVGIGGTVLTGVNSLYALRTSGDITGGTLKIGSISNSREGGMIVNGNVRISSNLIIDPTSADARQVSSASGEGVFYVAPNVTLTLAGDLLANSFTKFGGGKVVFSGGNNSILGALTVQEGTLEVAPGAQFARLATDLVLNGQGTLDLNGNDARFSSLYNTAGVGGGIITNTGSSDASLTIFAPTATVAVPPSRAGVIGQNTNKVITGLASTADLQVGMSVSGTNIAGGAYIQSIDSPTQITIAAPGNNANVSPSTQTVTFGSSIFAGRIMDGPTNKLTFVKNGAGTVILGGFSTAAPRAGDNTFSGGTILNQGTLQIQNPLALGGADGSTPGVVTLFGGTLDLRDDGGGINGTIILGNQQTDGVDVVVAGPATINVDRFSSPNTGNVWQINDLTLSENTLSISGANNYGLRVAGTTTIAGDYAAINSLSDQANGNIQFDGQIVGAGALNKYGTAIQRVATINGSNNTYSGGTNIVSGSLQITATSGTPLGTGRVNVFPGAMLRIAGLDPTWQPGSFSSVPGQAQLHVLGYYNSLGVVALDNSFDPSSLLTAANFSNAYGSLGVALSNPFFTQTLDMSTIGDGRAFLTSGINTEVAYVASNLIPGVGNGVAPRTYRLAGGVSNLAFIGVDNVLNDLAGVGTSVQVGSLNSVFGSGGAIGMTGNSVILRNSNSYTGGTWIGKGSGLSLGVGGSPAGSTPLGSADGTVTGAPTDVIIYGTLQLENRLEASYFNAATGKNANNYILMPGGNINITDFAGQEAGGNGRWADTDANGGGLNLNGGSFRYNGAANLDSSERVGTFTVSKDSRILLDRSNNSGTVTLIVNDLPRVDHGVLQIQALQGGGTTANILGIPAQTTLQLQEGAGYDHLIINTPGSAATVLGGTTSMGAGAVNSGMAPGWIIDASANSFVTYNPTAANTGFQTLVTSGSPGASSVASNGTFTPGANQVGYSKVITGSGTISGSITLTANDIVDVNAGGGVTLNSPSTSVYALRTNRDINPTAANNTLTIASGALLSVGNTLNLNAAPAATNAAPLDMTVNFGVGGNAEALIYTSSSMTINAQINAAGLTHSAASNSQSVLTLTGDNHFTGPIVNNQGILQGTNTLSGIGLPVSGVFDDQDIYLSGANNRDASRLIIRAGVGDATSSVLASNVEATSQIGGTIFVNGDSRLDTNGGVFQRINNLTFADLGPMTPVGLALGNIYVAGTTTLGAHDNYIEGFFNTYSSSVFGGLVQGGTLTKFGNGTMLMAGTANTYASTVINQGGTNTASSIFGSLTRTGQPFGTGSITINPGAMLRIADASNITPNVVTLKSDGIALGGLAIAYNSSANIADLFGTGPGKVSMSSTGDYLGVIALDVTNYINPIDMGALEAAAGGKLWLGTSISATYMSPTLAPASDNVYRLGGGGNQGNLTIGGNGAYENVLTGTASVVIGAETAGSDNNGPAYINGNFGSIVLSTRNDFSGGVTLNNQAGLTLNNSYALGTGILYHNGGNLTLNNTVTIANEMDMIGDTFSTSSGGNAALTGEMKLAPQGVGGIVTLNMNGGGHLGFEGVISGSPGDGTSGSNIVKTGSQTIIFNGMNTYRGTTSVTTGFLGIGTDVYANAPGALGINDVPLILSSTGGFLLGGQITMDRSLMTSGTDEIRGQTLALSVISGGIAVTSGTIIIDETSTNNGTFRGGVIDIQGPISGAGTVQIGNANVQGSVRLSAQANGYGTNTFTGGLVLSAGRLQINSDTYYTGPADSPTILSGPLGTGTLTFGSGNGNAGGEIVAYGADRTVVNAMAAMSTAADTTVTFGGHYDLTFTRDLNINSDSSLRNRTFNVLASQGETSFLGDLTSSGAAGGRITKNGAGTLVLEGNNTFFGTTGTSLITLSAGVIRFSADMNLGRVSTTQSNFTISGAGALALEGTTPVTWDAASSNRNLNLTSSSGAIEVDDANGLFTMNTRVTGAFGLLKQGAGTLALNANNNQITNLVIGGAPVAAAANLAAGLSGGTVSTTATSGTPFGTASITLYDGTLSLVGGATAQALSIPTLNFGGDSDIQFNHGTTTSQLTGTTIARLNQGTLTLLPTTIAALGDTERLIAGNFAAFPVANGMLATPSVFVRLPGVGQDANFATYGANGFQLHTASTQGAFTTSDATLMVDIAGGSQVAPNSAFNVLALRTDSNITAAGPNSQINITNGGLILNGNAAPVIDPDLYFGDGTSTGEAIVYVRDGQTGAATLAGDFTAANFTKSGGGTLLISGTNNVMTSSPTTLPTLQINDGIVRFAGQSSLPNQGAVGISPMDTGTFDLAGQSLTVGALGGNAVASAATGIVMNSGAAASLEVFTRNGVTSNFNGLIEGDINLIASGRGTLILGYNNTYTGGTRIDAGPIASANGLYTGTGALQINSFNSLGAGPVILDGGTLDIRNPVAPNEVEDNIDVISLGSGDGYDFVISALNNFGSANTTSTINFNGTAGFQAIHSLTIDAPVLSTGGGTDNGLLVRGTTTLAGDTILNVGRALALGGKIEGSGATVTKIGGSTLYITNADRDAGANDVGGWAILQGTMEVRLSQGGSNPLGDGNEITLNGASLNLRHDGDNLSDPQVLDTFRTNDLLVGSFIPVTTVGYTSSANSTLDTRTISAGNNKTLQLGQLRFGGPLGTAFLSFNSGNTYSVEFTDGLSMIHDGALSFNQQNVTFDGNITGNGTLFKQGGAELDINTNATGNNPIGGTVLANGSTYFASWQGSTRTLNPNAKLPGGSITIQPNASLRFTAITNLNGGQIVDVRSNLSSLGMIGIGDDTEISNYNLRARGAAGVFDPSALTGSMGGGILALNDTYTHAIDLGRLGDGTWFLGSSSDGSGASVSSSVNGHYNGGALGAGAGFVGIGNDLPTYRLGGGGGTLYIGLEQPGSAANQLSGAANLVVGSPLTNGGFGSFGVTATSTTGSAGVILNQDQSYTGLTLVNHGSQLEFRGAMATSGYDVFGILVAGGTNGSFAGGPTPILRPGGEINLDNQFDLLPVGNVEGRWGDTTAVNLNSDIFRVIGNSAADLREVVGQVSASGGSYLIPQRAFGGRIMELNIAGLTRVGTATLSIESANSGALGSDERVTVAGADLASQLANIPGGIVNGMVAPWMFNGHDVQFLTYSDFGFVNAGFTRVANGTLSTSSSTLTDRTFISGTSTMAPGALLNTYALRSDANITLTSSGDTTAKIIIGSGGLMSNNAINITPGLVFGSIATPAQAIIVNNNNLVIGSTSNPSTSGQITATDIVKAGDGNMFMDAEQGSFSGPIALNRGGLFIRSGSTTAIPSSNAGGKGSVITINGYGLTVGFRSDATNGGTFFNNSVVIGQDNLLGIINFDRAVGTSVSDKVVGITGGITFAGAPGEQGQTLTLSVGNSMQFEAQGGIDFGPVGNSILNVPDVFVNNTRRTVFTVDGQLTGDGTFVKAGNGQMAVNNLNSLNDYTGGTDLLVGNLIVRAAANPVANDAITDITAGGLGTGPINLLGGVLFIQADADNTTTTRERINFSNDLHVLGNTQIDVNRNGIVSPAGTANDIRFASLSIGSQTLAVTGGNSYALEIGGTTTLLGNPTFNVSSADLVFRSEVDDGGGDNFIVKNGGATMWFNSANNFSGGIFVNSGALRFGDIVAGNNTANAGTGLITINPGANIQLQAATNLLPGQQVAVHSIPNALGTFLTFAVLDPTRVITSDSTGLLRIPTNYNIPLDLSAIGDGTFQLGTTGNNSYTAPTLGVGAGNIYRLSGGGQTLNINSFDNVLTGTARLVVGSLNSSGTLALGHVNDYTGGSTVVRSSTLQWTPSTTDVSPLGTGQVDVFGQTIAYGTGGNYKLNTFVFHPGATIRIDNNAGGNVNVDRWDDSTAVPLNGATLSFNGRSGAISTETYGDLTFAAGSRIALSSQGTGQVELSMPGFAREENGTMVFTTGAANRLGIAAGNNSERVLITGSAPAIADGMLPGYYVNGTDNTFVTYDAVTGFQDAAFTQNYGTTFGTGLTAGTDLVNVTATSTLSDDPVIHALRLANASLNNGTGQFNTITFAESGSSMGGVIVSGGNVTINPNLTFGVAGNQEALFYIEGGRTATVMSDITAGSITKFGTGVLQINKDQNDAARGPGQGYSGGWVVNEGQLTVTSFGGLGNAVASNTVTLVRSASSVPVLRLQINNASNSQTNTGNVLNQMFTSGKIIAVDDATISYDSGADDRSNSIADLEVRNTGGDLLDARLHFDIVHLRVVLQAGHLTLDGNGIIDVNASSVGGVTSGSSVGLSVADISGAGRLTKWGNGVLYVRGDSNGYTAPVNIEQGAISVSSNGALGTGAITVNRFGILDVAMANYTPTNSSITYLPGSIERWSVDGARTGNINLGGGTLQIGMDQSNAVAGTTVVTLNGGSIEGYLRTDDNIWRSNNSQGAVYRTVNTGTSFILAGDSYLGQNITEGANGLDNGVQPNAFTPYTNAAAGVLLEIKGNISGIGGLTKQGYDTVTLSGHNTYSGGTTVMQGMLRIGANDSLLTTGALATNYDGVFDLNGFNQTVGELGAPAKTVDNSSGFITNTATTLNTLTVGNGYNADMTYGGVIQYNVALTKNGLGELMLTGANTFYGATIVNAGGLRLTHATGNVLDSLLNTASLTLANGTSLQLRTGTGAGRMTLIGSSGTVLTLGGNNLLSVEVGGGGGTGIALNAGAKAQVTGTVTVNVYGTSTGAGDHSIVISAPGGGLLTTNGSSGNFVLGKVFNNTDFIVTGLTQTDTLVQLNTQAEAALTAAYWVGGFSNEWAASGAGVSNWASDLTGTVSGLVPGPTTDVFLSAQNRVGQDNMVLGANMTIQSLTINSTSGDPVVLKGDDGKTLTITSASPITADAGAGSASLQGSIALTAPVATITVNSTNPLEIDGAISGGAITKTGTGTLVLAGANTFTGPTVIAQGTLKIGANNALPALGDLDFGTSDSTASSTTAGALDLSGHSTTVLNLGVFTNSTTAVNEITIGAGQVLQVDGALTVGPNVATANTTTKLTISGPGTLQVGTPSAPTLKNFSVGGSVANNFGNAATLDMSGLANFFANLGSGTFAVGDQTDSGGGGTGSSTLTLAVNNTIMASVFSTDGAHFVTSNNNQRVNLGSGTNIIDANTFNLGIVNNRGNGSIGYAAGNTTGTLKVRALDGVGRAIMNVAYGNSQTGASPTETVDLTGHDADLLLNTLNIGGRTQVSGASSTGIFRFDQGVLDVLGVVLGDRRVTSGTGGATGTLELLGGNVDIGAGGISMGSNTATAAGNTASGTVNIGGDADVTVGETSGVSITMGHSTLAGSVANATLNVTGTSRLSVAGDIVEATGAGNAAIVSTVTLNGGTLEMNGHNLGTATEAINNLNFQSGTLRNVGAINGTDGLTKTTTGTLIMEGTNSYTGVTNVNAGTLLVRGSLNGSTVAVNNTGILGGAQGLGTATTGSVTVNAGGTLAPGEAPGTTGILTTLGDLTFGDGAIFQLEINGTTAGSGYDQQIVTGNTLISSTDTVLTLGGTYDLGATGDIFTVILNSGGMTTTGFANAPNGSIITASNGQAYQISYFDDASTAAFELSGGNDVSLRAMTIPEPNDFSMLIASLGFAFGLQRFRGGCHSKRTSSQL